MLSRLWRSLGRGTGVAAKSIKSTSGPVQAAIAIGQLAVPARGVGGATGRVCTSVIRAGCATALVMPRVGRATVRLCGSTSALLKRATLVGFGTHVSFNALARMLSIRSRSSSSVKSAEEQAEKIAGILNEKDIAPDRIGIDGLPGSGKSTLARALAKRLGMKHESLDYTNLRLPGIMSPKHTVYEHHRLLRTQDVDAFDVIIYIDMSARRCRARVCRRGRGLFLAAVLDYNKLKKVGKLAFDVCEGEPVPIADGPLILKIKPPGGFRALENTASRLKSPLLPSTTGAAELDTSGMSKEEMLFLLACGKRKRGLKAYLMPLDYVSRVGRLTAALHSAGRSFVKAWCAEDSSVRRAHGAAARVT